MPGDRALDDEARVGAFPIDSGASDRKAARVAEFSASAPDAPYGTRSQRLIVLLTGLVAALPVLVSVVRALTGDWTLEGDQAIAATRAYDVLTRESPLVGPWSTTSSFLGQDAFHPGPLLYWLLAVPTRVPGVESYPVVMGAVNVAAVMGVVALAHRRGGRALMFAAAAALALMCSSLSTEVVREVWNPSAPVVPFALLIFLCWSLACGDLELLPLTILVASFAMQCHLIFLLPTLVLIGTGLAGCREGTSPITGRCAASRSPPSSSACSPGVARSWTRPCIGPGPIVATATSRRLSMPLGPERSPSARRSGCIPS